MPAPTQAAYIEHAENLLTGAYTARGGVPVDQAEQARRAADAWRRFRGDP